MGVFLNIGACAKQYGRFFSRLPVAALIGLLSLTLHPSCAGVFVSNCISHNWYTFFFDCIDIVCRSMSLVSYVKSYSERLCWDVMIFRGRSSPHAVAPQPTLLWSTSCHRYVY